MSLRYRNARIFITPEGRRYYSNPIYPNVPPTSEDLYIQTSTGDRFDLLAQRFYEDSTLWWVIAKANPGVFSGSLTVPSGVQLRIPGDRTDALRRFVEVNQNR